MMVIEGGGGIVEPEWALIYSDPLDVDAAARHWRSATDELRAADTLAEANRHQIMRLVMLRIVHDRAASQVADEGAVLAPKRRSKTAIARVNPQFSVQMDSASALDRIEAELGISPRRRAAAGKVDRKQRARRASDAYLKPVAGVG